MIWNNHSMLRVAILDMYERVENQGMRCIREILNQFAELNHIDLELHEFEVRIKEQLPGLDYDIYISSGGPGSPLDSEGSSWEKKYFSFLKKLEAYNASPSHVIKKQVFFICHSFQLACRYFKVASITKRNSTAFGVFPMHSLNIAHEEIIFDGLKDPFYAVDSRDYQVTEPNHNLIHQMGGCILAIEKARPHVPYERAIMAMRFNENMIGTQFHPEADAQGMLIHLHTENKKQTVVENHGLEKWSSMIEHLNDPDKIMLTYAHILPNFLNICVNNLQVAVV